MNPSSRPLPEGWRIVRFGDVVRNAKVKVDPETSGLERYVAGGHMETDNLHIRNWGTIGDGYLGPAFHRRFVKGQVLYGSRRTYLRKVAVAEFDGVCANTTFVLEPKGNDLLPEFLPFIMQTEAFTEHSIKQSTGSTNPYVNWKDLAWYEFPLPPLEEQRRIANILWAADAIIDKHALVLKKMFSFRQSLLRESFVPSELGSKGKNFKSMSLSEVLTYASDGPFGSKLKTEHYTNAGARVTRLQNIDDGSFNDSDKAYISESYYQELVRYALHPGDIVVAGLGDENHPVGRACQIPSHIGKAINKADCFCLRANDSIVEQEYILHFLNSPYARLQVRQRAQGTTRLRINVANIKTISVPVQSQDAQQEICWLFRSFGRTYDKAVATLQATQVLATSLRERLLTGDK
ncbi:MAG TPA: restriction endonuclease subunit S [Anaerolineae bacterium]|nr:restriction endonuclease subunit S [Anaerolineae bacterium]